MAEARSTVELVFAGIDRTSEATRAALGNAQQFTETLQGVTQPIADVTKSALKLEAAILTAGAAITTFAIVTAGSFDEAFREIATLIDEPIESLDEFRQAILDYASSSTQALPEVTGAVYAAISAGVDYTDSLAAVAAAEQLAVAGKADLQQSLVVLVSSMNAYGVSMDQAEDFADALFTTVRMGQTTLPELASSLAQVTTIAANAGVDFDELLAAVAALTAAGMPTSQAITSIRAALSNIISPTQQAQQTAAELGIEFGAAALESKGFEGVLQDVIQATGGNVETISKLFGSVQALASILALGGEGADAFGDSLEAMENKTGAVATAYEKMAEAFSNQNQRMVNAMTGLLVQIGQPLLEAYGDMASGIAAIFQALGVQVREGELGEIVAVVEEIIADAAQALNRIAEIIPEADFSAAAQSIVAGLTAIRNSLGNLFGTFDLSTAEGLQDVIELLGQAFNALSQFSASAIDVVAEVVRWLADGGIQKVAEFAEEWASLAGKIGGIVLVGNALLPFLNTFLIAAQGIVTVMSSKGIAISTVTTGLSALAVKLAPAGAVIIALGYLVSKVMEGAQAFNDLRDANERSETALRDMEQLAGHLSDRYEEISNRTGVLVTNHEELAQAVEDGALAFDESTGLWVKATDSVRDFDKEVKDKLNESIRESGERVRELQEHLIAAGLTAEQVGLEKPFEEAGEAAEDAEEKSRGYIKTISEDGTVVFTDFGKTGRKAFEDIDDAARDVMNTSDELRIRFREIARDEYIATIQAKVELDVARLEAETRRVEAAFESVNVTIASTGDVINTMVNALAGFSASTREWNELLRLIDREEARRDQAVDLQRRLIETQIEQLRERTRAMQRGQALIEVDGSGLQPHLEAFMWEVLRAIQTRVNEDGLDMLLGMEA